MISFKFQTASFKNKGFTLVEMMITLLIFSVIIGVVIGLFVSAIKVQRYNLTYQQLLDQTSYALEYMSRAIRMARKSDGACSGMSPAANYEWTANSIRFETYHSPSQCWEFYSENEQLKVNRDGIVYELTSDDFEVNFLRFSVSGWLDSDDFQPQVTIFTEIQGGGSPPQPKINIQTTVSQRNLDEEPE